MVSEFKSRVCLGLGDVGLVRVSGCKVLGAVEGFSWEGDPIWESGKMVMGL